MMFGRWLSLMEKGMRLGFFSEGAVLGDSAKKMAMYSLDPRDHLVNSHMSHCAHPSAPKRKASSSFDSVCEESRSQRRLVVVIHARQKAAYRDVCLDF